MTYNIDFLIAAMVILLLVLWYFLGQKRAEDLNNQVFLFFAIIGILDVVAELASNYYISFPNSNCCNACNNNLLSASGIAAVYGDLLYSDIT